MTEQKHTPFENALAEAFLAGCIWMAEHNRSPRDSEIFRNANIKDIIARQEKEYKKYMKARTRFTEQEAKP